MFPSPSPGSSFRYQVFGRTVIMFRLKPHSAFATLMSGYHPSRETPGYFEPPDLDLSRKEHQALRF
jgi:hypothetical protein